MINLCDCSEKPSAGTFSTASQTALTVNSVVSLNQQVLVGKSISFTPPNIIKLQPGGYMVHYSLMGNPTATTAETSIVGLRLNNSIITQTSIGNSTGPAANSDYLQAVGSYLIIVNQCSSILQLVALSNINYDIAAVNAALTAANTQTAQLTIFKL